MRATTARAVFSHAWMVRGGLAQRHVHGGERGRSRNDVRRTAGDVGSFGMRRCA